MQKQGSKNNDFISDPALGGAASARSRRDAGSQTARPKPTPDSVGPKTTPKKKKAQSKPESYNFISFLRDYRTHLSVGLILCAVALMMAVSTVSYLFNSTADQSVTHGRTIQQIVESGEQVANAGGAVGAKVAEWLMVDAFGVASFVLVFYLAMLGLGCMRVIKIKFFSLTFRCLFTTAALSVILGFCTYNSVSLFHLGGNHGHQVNTLVMAYADMLGALGLTVVLAGLLVALFLYPIKAMFRAIANMKPRRTVPEPSAQETDSPDYLEHLESEQDEIIDETSEITAEPEAIAAEANVPESPVEQPVVIDIPAEHSRYVPPMVDVFESEKENDAEPADEEPIEADYEKTAEKKTVASAKVGDPELVIINNSIENDEIAEEPEVKVIRHGDHIGMDEAYDVRASHSRYEFPSLELLTDRPKSFEINEEEQAANKELIVNALRSYDIEIVRIEATIGPTVTLYEIVPAQGTRISKIKSLEDDIAMTLSAYGIRIIAPIPGKGSIGIEVPNSKPQVVSMRTVLESRKFRENKMNLPMALGATISNEIFMADLCKMPHLLVAGATGQGKSVGLNCIITSLLYSKHPDELKFVLIDPKMVEFSLYRTIDRQYLAKLPDEENAVITDPSKVIDTLNSLCVEMDQRYELLQNARVRGVEDYNERFTQRMLNPNEGHRYLPYIVMIVDEYADLVMVAGKEIQQPICRIAQKARAVGMHMIIATQRPSTDVITGMIKANFPARIAFKVTQGIDSKTILDRTGAQRLIGRGDMLILINGIVDRVQCALVETGEVEAICQHIGSQPGFIGCYELPEAPVEGNTEVSSADMKIDDEFRRCALFIAAQTSASITSLQRNFSVGFNKAGRYMDQMERLGIVGAANGAKPRSVLMTPDQVERLLSEL